MGAVPKIKIDYQRHDVFVRGIRLVPDLTNSQFRIFAKLVKLNRIVDRDELMTAMGWDKNPVHRKNRTVDQAIRRLRIRLAELSQAPLIQTVQGCGYKFIGKA